MERYLPTARQQVGERLRKLVGEDAAPNRISAARTELAYVRHAKGPIYQSHLLTYLGVRQVDAVISAEQTPLERVREIGAALGVQINAQQSVPGCGKRLGRARHWPRFRRFLADGVSHSGR
jgi:cell filamentation protein